MFVPVGGICRRLREFAIHPSSYLRFESFCNSSSIQTGVTVNLECSNRQGAALLIKHPAYREDALRRRDLRKYMLKHYRTWLPFIRDNLGREIELSEVVLVTGCDLTADWATAAFVEGSKKASISFTVGDPIVATAQASLWGSWQTSVNVPHRCGPSPSTRPVPNDALVPRVDASPATEFNQCIFIRSFRMMERPLFLPPVLKAAAGYQTYEKQHDSDHTPCVRSGPVSTGLVVQESNDGIQPRRRVRYLNA